MCLCLEYLIHYKSTNGAFLDQIITGDETSLHHVICYTEDKDRLHGMEWYGDTLILLKKKKFKTVDLVPRIMAAVIRNAEDLVLVGLVHIGETACSSLLQHTRQTVTTQHCWNLF